MGRVRTTDSRHDFPIAPNLLERNFSAAALEILRRQPPGGRALLGELLADEGSLAGVFLVCSKLNWQIKSRVPKRLGLRVWC
jgi:hypothetical protein